MFLKSPRVRFQQRKYFLSIPCIHARRSQTAYAALLLLHKASRFRPEVTHGRTRRAVRLHGRSHQKMVSLLGTQRRRRMHGIDRIMGWIHCILVRLS